MKTVKKIGKVLGILVALIIIASLFFPSTAVVERSITINAPAASIFSQINQMSNWSNWGGPWHKEGMDYNEVIQRTEGAEAGVGSLLVYNQGKGEGTVQVIESTPSTYQKTLITFEDGNTANGEWKLVENSGSTQVTWSVSVPLGYNPLKRIMGNLMMDGEIGPLFEQGLSNLSAVASQ